MTLLYTLVTLVALFITSLGLYGMIAPKALARFVSLWRSERGLWTAATVRVAFGIALWLVAPYGHAPLVLRILAGVTVAAGIALPFLGLARFLAVLDWWSALPDHWRRAWLGTAAFLGVFMLWAVAG